MKKTIIWESKHLFWDSKLEKMAQVNDEWSEENEQNGLFEELDIPIKQLAALPFAANSFCEINDDLSPLKQFRFYLAHTNFNITMKTINTVLKIPGIEVLRPLTRYRFIIAVGKAFNVTDVKLAVESALCNKDILLAKTELIKDSTTRDKVLGVAKELDKTDCQWQIIVMPNGEVDFTVNAPEFTNQYESDIIDYKECVKNCGAILIESGSL